MTLETFMKLLKGILKVDRLDIQGINGLDEIYVNNYRVQLNPRKYGVPNVFTVRTLYDETERKYCIERDGKIVRAKPMKN